MSNHSNISFYICKIKQDIKLHSQSMIIKPFVKDQNSSKWSNSTSNSSNSTNSTCKEYKMSLADMDISLPQPFKKQILSKIQQMNNFTYKNASQDYNQAIIDWYGDRFINKEYENQKLSKEHIIGVPSINTLFYLIMRIFTKENDSILIFTPVYSEYANIASLHRRNQIVQCKLKRQSNHDHTLTRYQIDFDDLERLCSLHSDIKIMVICNPHNPTGRIWTKSQLNQIVKICTKYDILMFADEIMSDLIPPHQSHKFISMINYTKQHPKIIIGNSISKGFNSSSMRGGYTIIKDQKIRSNFMKQFDVCGLKVNQIAIKMVEVYYTNSGKLWLSQIARIIQNNYKAFLENVKNTRLIVYELEASYLMALDFKEYEDIMKRLLIEMKIKYESGKVVKTYLERKGFYFTEMAKYQSKNVKIKSIEPALMTEMRVAIAIEEDTFETFVKDFRKMISQLQEKLKLKRQLDEIKAKL